MGSHDPHDRPSTVIAEQGEVHIDGADGVAAALTPDAAEETGHRLILAASRARLQLDDSVTPDEDPPASEA